MAKKDMVEKIVEKKEVSWRAAEYEYSQKSFFWYLPVGGVAAVLVIIALWQKNFFFAVFIVLAAALLMFFSKTRPQLVSFKINEDGVTVGKAFYEYERFEEFSVRSRPYHLDEIFLKKKTALNPYLRIPIDSHLAVDAKVILGKKLPEAEYKESLIEIFSDWLRF